jgi:hypothetical protein
VDTEGDPRERADEENVDRAVVPAVRVEEGIAEQCPTERGEDSFEVDSDNEYARTFRAQPTARESEDEMEEERKREARGQRAKAHHQGRPTLPASPERREPGKTGEQRQVAGRPGRPGEGRDEAGRHERKTGDDGESGSEVGTPCIGRELARATRDGECAQAVDKHQCPGGEPSDVRRADRNLRHRPIVAPSTAGTLVLATTHSRASNDVLGFTGSYRGLDLR